MLVIKLEAQKNYFKDGTRPNISANWAAKSAQNLLKHSSPRAKPKHDLIFSPTSIILRS